LRQGLSAGAARQIVVRPVGSEQPKGQ